MIDDDADIRKLLKIRLGAEGYDTAFAWDADTALTIARKESPDLIVLDLGLPGGDGYVVMERLQTLAPFAMIPIVVLSAQPTNPNAEKSTGCRRDRLRREAVRHGDAAGGRT